MRLFATREERARLHSALPFLSAQARSEALVELAWYERQNDPERARQLADERRRDAGTMSGAASAAALARLDLIAAERAWLEGSPETALLATGNVMGGAEASTDPHLVGDANLLKAMIANSIGAIAQRDSAIAAACACVAGSDDPERQVFAEATRLRLTAKLGDSDSRDQWRARAESLQAGRTDLLGAVEMAMGGERYEAGDMGGAAQAFARAFERQVDSGQVFLASISAANVADAFALLNETMAALEWAQRGLDLVEGRAWPIVRGMALLRVGESLRRLKRLAQSEQMLNEALALHGSFRTSRGYALVVAALAETLLAQGKHERALAVVDQFEQAFDAQDNPRLTVEAAEHRARALFGLSRHADARATALRGLALAGETGFASATPGLLYLAAKADAAEGRFDEARERLLAALAGAVAMPGKAAVPELFEALAEVHAAQGDFGAAYEVSRKAIEARAKSYSAEAERNATGLEVRLATERARAETEQQRQRAEMLLKASATLEHLGAVGQQITAMLDKQRVFEAIHRHVGELLDVQSFSIYLMDPDGLGLTSVYDIEDGVPLPPDHIALDDQDSCVARCVHERSELLIHFPPGEFNASHIPGTLLALTAFFAPLAIGERMLGVMTIQSGREHAYDEQDRLVFRTLCAYAAIALDNSVAYGHLRDAQQQLVAQEKLAALGGLVAGVAHELNTPIGNSLLAATSLRAMGKELAAAIEAGQLRRSTLGEFLQSVDKATVLIQRGLESASHLVATFKQVAVDRATEQRRRFNLLATTQDIVETLSRRVTVAGHRVDIAIADDIELDGYPGPYGQVITNFVTNAMAHAFPEGRRGVMRIDGRRIGARQAELIFSDDGTGISDANLSRVFDPFFTTRLGQGGSGLGLAISYNIATTLFGGELRVESKPGQGARFVWRLPLVAPEKGVADPHAM